VAIDRLSPYRAWSGERLISTTVETPGVAGALSYVESYLRADPGAHRTWKGLMVIGPFGIGKTHLAQAIAQRLTAEEEAKVRLLVLDSPVGDFSAVYRNSLVGQLDRFDLYDRLKDYYASVVADELAGSPVTRDLADGLRNGRYDPQKVVEHFGLVESALRDQLRRHLLRVTEIANFSKAFTLALIPEHEQGVWEWLQGRPASETLRAYGITSLIDGESSAFDALGVLAFLYGRVGYKFVLVVDEFDKMLMGSDERRRLLILQSVERLLNVFIDSDGLFVFCALPDVQHVLLPSTRERVRTVRLSPFTPGELAEYVRQALGDAAPRFPDDAVDYVCGLTGGVPRQALALCGHAWERARSADVPVSTEIVRAAVHEQYERATRDDVRASVRQVIQAAGWHFEMDHPLDPPFDEASGGLSTVDFWIPLWESGPGLAVLIVDSLLEEGDLDALRRRVRSASSPEVVLVVNGFLSASLRESVSSLIGRQPLVYEEEPFNDALRDLVTATLHRMENATQEDNLATLRRRMDRLTQQQSFTQSFLEQMSGRIDRFGSEANRRLSLLQGRLGEPRPPARGGRAAPVPSAGLPQEVQEHFDRALSAVNTLAGLDDLFGDAFSPGFSPGAGGTPRRRLASRALFEAAGVAVVFQRLLEAFREAVADWLHTARVAGGGRPPGRDQQERLRLICRTYMTTAEVLPLFQLESLAAYAPFSSEATATEQTSRSIRRGEATEALDNLGERVLDAALAAAMR
jgi:type II secretory pathway predicted ATPase ExeA